MEQVYSSSRIKENKHDANNIKLEVEVFFQIYNKIKAHQCVRNKVDRVK